MVAWRSVEVSGGQWRSVEVSGGQWRIYNDNMKVLYDFVNHVNINNINIEKNQLVTYLILVHSLQVQTT